MIQPFSKFSLLFVVDMISHVKSTMCIHCVQGLGNLDFENTISTTYFNKLNIFEKKWTLTAKLYCRPRNLYCGVLSIEARPILWSELTSDQKLRFSTSLIVKTPQLSQSIRLNIFSTCARAAFRITCNRRLQFPPVLYRINLQILCQHLREHIKLLPTLP